MTDRVTAVPATSGGDADQQFAVDIAIVKQICRSAGSVHRPSSSPSSPNNPAPTPAELVAGIQPLINDILDRHSINGDKHRYKYTAFLRTIVRNASGATWVERLRNYSQGENGRATKIPRRRVASVPVTSTMTVPMVPAIPVVSAGTVAMTPRNKIIDQSRFKTPRTRTAVRMDDAVQLLQENDGQQHQHQHQHQRGQRGQRNVLSPEFIESLVVMWLNAVHKDERFTMKRYLRLWRSRLSSADSNQTARKQEPVHYIEHRQRDNPSTATMHPRGLQYEAMLERESDRFYAEHRLPLIVYGWRLKLDFLTCDSDTLLQIDTINELHEAPANIFATVRYNRLMTLYNKWIDSYNQRCDLKMAENYNEDRLKRWLIGRFRDRVNERRLQRQQQQELANLDTVRNCFIAWMDHNRQMQITADDFRVKVSCSFARRLINAWRERLVEKLQIRDDVASELDQVRNMFNGWLDLTSDARLTSKQIIQQRKGQQLNAWQQKLHELREMNQRCDEFISNRESAMVRNSLRKLSHAAARIRQMNQQADIMVSKRVLMAKMVDWLSNLDRIKLWLEEGDATHDRLMGIRVLRNLSRNSFLFNHALNEAEKRYNQMLVKRVHRQLQSFLEDRRLLNVNHPAAAAIGHGKPLSFIEELPDDIDVAPSLVPVYAPQPQYQPQHQSQLQHQSPFMRRQLQHGSIRSSLRERLTQSLASIISSIASRVNVNEVYQWKYPLFDNDYIPLYIGLGAGYDSMTVDEIERYFEEKLHGFLRRKNNNLLVNRFFDWGDSLCRYDIALQQGDKFHSTSLKNRVIRVIKKRINANLYPQPTPGASQAVSVVRRALSSADTQLLAQMWNGFRMLHGMETQMYDTLSQFINENLSQSFIHRRLMIMQPAGKPSTLTRVEQLQELTKEHWRIRRTFRLWKKENDLRSLAEISMIALSTGLTKSQAELVLRVWNMMKPKASILLNRFWATHFLSIWRERTQLEREANGLFQLRHAFNKWRSNTKKLTHKFNSCVAIDHRATLSNALAQWRAVTVKKLEKKSIKQDARKGADLYKKSLLRIALHEWMLRTSSAPSLAVKIAVKYKPRSEERYKTILKDVSATIQRRNIMKEAMSEWRRATTVVSMERELRMKFAINVRARKLLALVLKTWRKENKLRDVEGELVF
ncbi:hypothetical protein GQ42DRAFT_176249 [Ramicandelaber brevisporus]|nr:hypothetical protein GQ42DRAFT_176249 [Ramicandelaber brevisporus]